MSFLAPLLGAIAGPLLGGLFGSKAAAPAAAAANSAETATANLTNALMNQYTQTFGPAEASALGTYQQQANAIPTQNILQGQILQDLLPAQMPMIDIAQGQFGIQNQVDQTVNALKTELAQRGISGPAAESLLAGVREQGIASQAKFGTDVGVWEANQTLANQGQAANLAMGAQALPAQYAQQVGGQLPGVAGTLGLDLSKLFSGQASAAAAPYTQAGQNVGQGLASIFATPSGTSAPPIDPYSYQAPYSGTPGVGLPVPLAGFAGYDPTTGAGGSTDTSTAPYNPAPLY